MRVPCEASLRQSQPLASCPPRSWGGQSLSFEGPTPRLPPPLLLVYTEEPDDPALEKQAFVFINQEEESQSSADSYQSFL